MPDVRQRLRTRHVNLEHVVTRISLLIFLLAPALVGRPSSATSPPVETCIGPVEGVRLVSALSDLTFAEQALQLLADRENPRLRAVLESRLVSSAHDAFSALLAPEMDAVVAPSTILGVQKARQYLGSHLTPSDAPAPSASPSPQVRTTALSELDEVLAWLGKQPRPPTATVVR
jgi:hypothetical protein